MRPSLKSNMDLLAKSLLNALAPKPFGETNSKSKPRTVNKSQSRESTRGARHFKPEKFK